MFSRPAIIKSQMGFFKNINIVIGFLLIALGPQTSSGVSCFECFLGLYLPRYLPACMDRNLRTCCPTSIHGEKENKHISEVFDFGGKDENQSLREQERFLEDNFPVKFPNQGNKTDRELFVEGRITRNQARKWFFENNLYGKLVRAERRSYGEESCDIREVDKREQSSASSDGKDDKSCPNEKKGSVRNPDEYLTFFHATVPQAIPSIKVEGLKPGNSDDCGAGGVYFTPCLYGSVAPVPRGKLRWPNVFSDWVESRTRSGSSLPRTRHVVMARMVSDLPDSKALQDEYAKDKRFLGKWGEIAARTIGTEGPLLNWGGLKKYLYSQVCEGDNLGRQCVDDTYGPEVVNLYPHMYSETELGCKGFELFFLTFKKGE